MSEVRQAGRWIRENGSVLDAAEIHRRWKAGACVCCNGPLLCPKAIGEEVQICGTCSGQGHLQRPGEIRAVLTGILIMEQRGRP